MKQIFWEIAAVACLAVGCSKDEAPVPAIEKQVYTELGASLSETRTTLSGLKVLWSLNDILSVWSDESNMPLDYTIAEGMDTPTGRFRTNDTSKGVSGTTFYAVYPSSLVTGPGTLMLPTEQTYLGTENFSTNTAPMAAVSGDLMNMSFKNLCGILVVELSGNSFSVNDITLEAWGGKAVAGTGRIDFTGTTPTLTCSGNSKLTLNCGGVGLNATTSSAFYFVVPAGTYPEGVDITINASSRTAGAMTFKKSRKSSFTINAGTVTRIGARFVLDATTYKVGDLYDAGGKKGVVFEVDNTGRSGKILALDDCSAGGTEVTDDYGTYYYYTWGPSKNIAATANVTDGWPNMENVVKAGIADYPAFAVCKALGDGWYLPASGEIGAVINAGSYCEIYGGSDLYGVGYWCSDTSGSVRAKTISYFDAETGELAKVSVSKQSDVTNSVRAIAEF